METETMGTFQELQADDIKKSRKEKTRPVEKTFTELLKEKYNEVIKEHGDFKSIVWNGKEKIFTINL